MCELFSGERTSYRFASESTREIPANIPFVILGTTQLPFAAQVISSLDQGHGLLDRFLFFVPCCLRPTPEQTLADKSKLCDVNVKSFTKIFWAMREEHLSKVEYGFTDSAKQMLMTLEREFIQQLNESLIEGIVGSKSKKVDLLQRLAVSLHVFNHIASKLLRGRKRGAPPKDVGIETVKKALCYLEYSLAQKEVIVDVSIIILSSPYA